MITTLKTSKEGSQGLPWRWSWRQLCSVSQTCGRSYRGRAGRCALRGLCGRGCACRGAACRVRTVGGTHLISKNSRRNASDQEQLPPHIPHGVCYVKAKRRNMSHQDDPTPCIVFTTSKIVEAGHIHTCIYTALCLLR